MLACKQMGSEVKEEENGSAVQYHNKNRQGRNSLYSQGRRRLLYQACYCSKGCWGLSESLGSLFSLYSIPPRLGMTVRFSACKRMGSEIMRTSLLEPLYQQRARRFFPKKVKKFHHRIEFYNYQYELCKAGKPFKAHDIELPNEMFMFSPYSWVVQVGKVIPCQKLRGWVAYYMAMKVDMYSSRGSDFASWDDGKIVDLQLVRCEREQGVE